MYAPNQEPANYWIFRAVRKVYSLEDNLFPGKTELWYSVREPKEMEPGDVVFFWQGGTGACGLYGWGRIYNQPHYDEQRETFFVPVRYEVRFEPHVDREDLRSTSLSDLPVIGRGQRQTFLSVTLDQAQRITDYLKSRGYKPLPPVAGIEPPPPDGERILKGVSSHAVTDLWTDEDHLGHAEYAKAISVFITHPETCAPLTISVQAPWGGGKSSMMRMVQKEIDPKGYEFTKQMRFPAEDKKGGVINRDLLDELHYLKKEKKKSGRGRPRAGTIDLGATPRCATVWFNAWKYQSTNQIWAGFADAIIRQLSGRLKPVERARFFLNLHLRRIDRDKIARKVLEKAFQGFLPLLKYAVLLMVGLIAILIVGPAVIKQFNFVKENIGWIVSGGGFSGLVASVIAFMKSHSEAKAEPAEDSFANYMDVPDYPAELGFIHHVTEDLRDVFDLIPVMPGSNGSGRRYPLVIFIDDLDRCSPCNVAEVFEAVNLFIAGEFPNCYFIIGMDTEVVAAALEEAHKDVICHLPSYDKRVPIGWRFMDKFVQLPFIIPPPDEKAVAEYAEFLASNETRAAGEKGAGDIAIDQTRTEKMIGPDADGDASDDELVDSVARANALDLNQETVKRAARRFVEKLKRSRFIERRAREAYTDREMIRALVINARSDFSSNPREIKRLVNMFRFYFSLRAARESRGEEVPTIDQITNWIKLSLNWPEVIRWIRRSYTDWEAESDTPSSMIGQRLRVIEEIAATTIPVWAPDDEKAARALTLDEWAGALVANFRLDESTPWLRDKRLFDFFRRISTRGPSERLSSGAGKGFW